ncbi:MAG: rhomboid family intramembrane serine protease [Cystobacterineae bacterium]|nr:rhomboid family intramembrane serine protease [Cystobacterineae bacterium]
MSRCIEHPRKLSPGPDGILTCRVCESAWMTPEEMEAMAEGALEFLSVETREKSGAFAKSYRCPDCEGLMTPMRIGGLDGWVEYCGVCNRYWADRVDRRSLQMIAKRIERQKAFGTLSSTEKKELAADLAKPSSSPSHWSQLSFGQKLLALLCIPMLERVDRNRLPWMTWSLATFLVLVFLAGEAWPEQFGPLALAWTPGAGATQLLWANFIHFDFLHLLSNVWFLLLFGDAMEQRLRRFWLLSAFIVSGPLSLLIEGLFTAPGVLVGGASGAISALIGASAIFQQRARIIITFYIILPRRAPFIWVWPIPLLLFVLLQLVYQAAMALQEAPGIAWVAHLSGLLTGIGLAFFVSQRSARFSLLFHSPPEFERENKAFHSAD